VLDGLGIPIIPLQLPHRFTVGRVLVLPAPLLGHLDKKIVHKLIGRKRAQDRWHRAWLSYMI
jgi:hypothetical protein